MTNKTTQFNYRTNKYTETELEKINKNKNYHAYLISLKDIFGDHGIIGMFILKKLDNKNVFLDTMLMSCRVLGRYLDHWIFNECRKIAKKNNYQFIISEFIKTERNSNFQSSLEFNGFQQINFKKINAKIYKSAKSYFYKTHTDTKKSKFDKIFRTK